MRILRCLLLSALLACGSLHAAAPATEQPVRVFAAASLTDALNEVASQWKRAGHPQPSLAFGASSALAKQVEAGAPADLYASADLKWMDYLDQRGRIDSATRANLLGNTLVLIAPAGKAFKARMQPGFAIAAAFKGKLCTGEPGVVPVGIYAKQALEHLRWWQPLQGRIVGTDDVRTALAFVERGECGAGIVYATDARISGAVATVAAFPAQTHAPIVYPFALTRDARPEAAAFLRFLRSPQAAAIFRRHGFTVPKD
ncbi:molybdate ABC transporter substrate-binding protein [Lysobacter solisilvae (ex Woo and Kim 2020)]|uniref:Molybdate ABC transporter substrate-binding protein n=1 Tax=Agrilutibacter terrestris TaxID=2865112 RepID=A0A7H0FUD7_9GAMM|nr:molybdate ABC transporter substrate-binding protein [Lysobacter terrestris]QNP39653.1 molybdate ABC transporter substrate-binding protein [Lysobacter terrestris]